MQEIRYKHKSTSKRNKRAGSVSLKVPKKYKRNNDLNDIVMQNPFEPVPEIDALGPQRQVKVKRKKKKLHMLFTFRKSADEQDDLN